MKQPTRQMLQAQLDQALARAEAAEATLDVALATSGRLSVEKASLEARLYLKGPDCDICGGRREPMVVGDRCEDCGETYRTAAEASRLEEPTPRYRATSRESAVPLDRQTGQPLAPSRTHDRDACDNPDCGTCMFNARRPA